MSGLDDMDSRGREFATTQSMEVVPRRGASLPSSGIAPGLSAGMDHSSADMAVRDQEHRANIIRLRKLSTAGLIFWPTFFASDLLMEAFVQPGVWPWLILPRSVAWLVMAICALLLRRGLTEQISRGRLLAIDAVLFGSACLAIAIMCVGFGGIASPYAAGIPVVLLCRAAYMATHWRVAALPVVLGGISYPVAVLIPRVFSADARDLLLDPSALSLGALYVMLNVSSMVFSMVGGHAAWSLRRQVFEARQLGRYRLIRRIGVGGMGEVWLAKHGTLRQQVAVKVLRPERLGDGRSLARFEREAQALAELVHPNTVRVFDYGVTEDGLWYYAMELVHGSNLAQLVESEGPISASRCAARALEVCDALREAHARGIVHRDLKPENVMICDPGKPWESAKLLDFGIAGRLDRDSTLTQTAQVLGTPAYMSPEAASGRAADERSDVFGVGAIVYYALTAARPYDGLDHIINREAPAPVRPGERNAAAAALDEVVMKCLKRDPEERYGSVDDVRRDLERSVTAWLSTAT